MTEEEPQISEEEFPSAPQEPTAPERPSFVTIQTPLDRPEFDFFLTQYMNKIGLKDKKQAAIQLTNMLYDAGLDPYSDLKDLQGTMREITGLLQSLPDSPQATQVKDSLNAVYAAKAGQLIMKKLPQINSGSSDSMQDRMQVMMDRYMPMIIAANMMSKMANIGGEPTNQQPAKAATVDIPEEYKRQMETIQEQLTTTQALLREQQEDKKQREHDEQLISTITQTVNPQIASLTAQVEGLTTAMQSKANEPAPRTEPTTEMAAITRQLEELKTSLIAKEKTGLNLTDLDTVMSTIETLEKRIRKDAPAGEFDWKATTISTMGEIGKEVVNAYREIQQSKPTQFTQQPQLGAAQTSAANNKLIAKQKLQSYILQNLSKGVKELRMDEAQRDLRLSPQEIVEVYNELVAEGWIKAKPDGTQPGPRQEPQPQPQQAPANTAQPTPNMQQQNPYEEAIKNLAPGEIPRDRFDPNAAFLER
jgi:hypothetical protein